MEIATKSFFSHYAKIRNNSKTIFAIKDKSDNWILEKNDIVKEFENHFGEVFNGPHFMQKEEHIYPKRILKSVAAN